MAAEIEEERQPLQQSSTISPQDIVPNTFIDAAIRFKPIPTATNPAQ
jgi:hypothetical protein